MFRTRGAGGPEVAGVAPIVVGVDGSAESRAALRWAYDHAEQVGRPVEVAVAWTAAPYGRQSGTAEARAVAVQALAAALPTGHRPIPVVLAHGLADDVLIRRSEHAELVVVAPHEVRLVHDHGLGMTSRRLLTTAPCPVAVVRIGAEGIARRHRIVVGVDGSRSSQAALAWATRLARLTDAKVDAITAWDDGRRRPDDGSLVPGPAQAAESTVQGCVERLPAHLRGVVRTEVVRGRAADALLDAGATADMIVVGDSRGGHHLTQLLGSVSREVAVRALVPVIVTHARQTDRSPGS